MAIRLQERAEDKFRKDPPAEGGNKAVFFDRDGTLIKEKHYLKDPDGVELTEGAAECIRALKRAGFLIVIVSNQSGIARGMMTEEEVRRVNDRLAALLREEGAQADGIYFCPHHPAGSIAAYSFECDCRKPKTGMAVRAASELGIDLSASYMVGDKAADIFFGKNAGMKGCFLVMTGYGEREKEKIAGVSKAECAKDLAQVCEAILKGERKLS